MPLEKCKIVARKRKMLKACTQVIDISPCGLLDQVICLICENELRSKSFQKLDPYLGNNIYTHLCRITSENMPLALLRGLFSAVNVY